MPTRDIKTKFVLEGEQEYKRSMTDAANAVKVLNSEQKLAQAQFEATGDSEQYAADQARILKEQISYQQKAVEAAEKALKKLTENGVDKNSRQVQTWQTKLNNAKTALVNMQTRLDKVGTELGEEQTEFGKTQKAGEDFQEGLKKIGEGINFQNTIEAIDNITGHIEAIVKGAARAAKALWDMGVDAAAYADNVATAASQMGVDAETYQSWVYASRFVDTSVEDIQRSWQDIQKKLKEDNTDYLGMLARMGISSREAAGQMRESQDIFWDAVDYLHGLSDASDQAAKANELFGNDWRRLMPLIEAGSEAYKERAEEGRQIAVVSNENIAALGEVDDKIQKVGAQFDALKYNTLAALAPTFSQVADALSQAIQALNEFVQSEEGQAALASLNEALSGLISSFLGEDNGKGTFKAIVEGASGAVQGLNDALTWIKDNGELVKGVVEGLGIAWAGLKVTKEVLTFMQLLKQIPLGKLSSIFGGGNASAEGMNNVKSGIDNAVQNAAKKRAEEESVRQVRDSAIKANEESAAAAKSAGKASEESSGASSSSASSASEASSSSSGSSSSSSASASEASSSSSSSSSQSAASASEASSSSSSASSQSAASAAEASSSSSGASSKAAIESGAASSKAAIESGAASSQAAIESGASSSRAAITSGESSSRAAITSGEASSRAAITSGESSSRAAITSGEASSRAAITSGSASSQAAIESGAASSQAAIESGASSSQAAITSGSASSQAAITSGEASSQAAITSGAASSQAAIESGASSSASAASAAQAAIESANASKIAAQSAAANALSSGGSNFPKITIKPSIGLPSGGQSGGGNPLLLGPGIGGAGAKAALPAWLTKILGVGSNVVKGGAFLGVLSAMMAPKDTGNNDLWDDLGRPTAEGRSVGITWSQYEDSEEKQADLAEQWEKARAEEKKAKALEEQARAVKQMEAAQNYWDAYRNPETSSKELLDASVALEQAFGDDLEGWLELEDKILEFANSQTWEDLQNAPEDLPSEWFIDGENAAIGLANGIDRQAHQAIGAAVQMARSVNAAVRQTLMIKSPSKVMAGLGEFVGLGFAQGIESEIGTVQRAAARMASATMTPISASGWPQSGLGGMGAYSSGGNDGAVSKPIVEATIVMDKQIVGRMIAPVVNDTIGAVVSAERM